MAEAQYKPISSFPFSQIPQQIFHPLSAPLSTMADTIVQMPIDSNQVREKKKGKTRKPLKPKNPSSNEANILAGKTSQSPLPVMENLGKENKDPLLSAKKTKPTPKTKSFEKDMIELQAKLEQMRLEKEKTEDLLKARDDLLKQKEEEIESRGKEQERLQLELKKLQKLKEFRPTVSFPHVESLREKEQGKKEKKKDKKKRPSTAYILWSKDQWNEVRKENPEAEFKDITTILGAKWKTLSAEEKKPYEEKYQADKEVYLQIVGKEKREIEAMKLLEDEQKQKMAAELLEQYMQFKQEGDKDSKKKKKERDPLKPKQPISAFFVYSKERRAALVEENKNILEIAKLAGEEWKNMNEKQRRPYEKIAKEQKEKYQHEMEVYKKKKDEEAASLRQEEEEQMKLQKHEALQLLKKKEKTEYIIKKAKAKNQNKKQKGEASKDPNKPKKPASSFLLFSKEARKNLVEERPGINNSTLTALISVKWKELAAAEKKIWNDRAAEAMEAYKKELEEYNKTAAVMVNSNPHP